MQFQKRGFMRPLDDSQNSCSPIFGPAVPKVPYATIPIDPALTAAEFQMQWHNPKEVIAVLLIIGGEIIQKALAQLTGGLIVPVAFSFGWVAYTFSSHRGHGRLVLVCHR